MERWIGKVAIVTGASSGIGEAIVKRLVSAGVKVAGFARRVEKVEKAAKELSGKSGTLLPVKCDITKENEIFESFEVVKKTLGPIHILVNNAGVSKATNLIDGDIETWKTVINTNFLGLCICTREAIKSMEENNIAGHIVHINSVAGHFDLAVPMLNVYPATKHAVTALTQTLRRELNNKKSNIKISSVSPGVVATEIIEAGGFLESDTTKNLLSNAPHLESEDVADALMYILGTLPHVMIQELIIRPVGEMI